MEKEHLEIILENIDKKFDIVIEDYSTLDRKIDNLAKKTDERFDLVDFKFSILNDKIDAVEETLTGKIDTVASDLKAHRKDTEVHHGIYRVKER